MALVPRLRRALPARPPARRRRRLPRRDTSLRIATPAAGSSSSRPRPRSSRPTRRRSRSGCSAPAAACPREPRSPRYRAAARAGDGVRERPAAAEHRVHAASGSESRRRTSTPPTAVRGSATGSTAAPGEACRGPGSSPPAGSASAPIGSSSARRTRPGRRCAGSRWRVVPLPAPVACQGTCWAPPHLDSTGHPMRWDWQIGRVAPLERTGARAVDLYDIDGFLTTRAQVRALHTTWQASTLPHPRAACYLDLAWEDYRPDATPSPGGFPAAALGRVYYGYPQERWVDLRRVAGRHARVRRENRDVRQKGLRRGRDRRHRQLQPAVDDGVPAHAGATSRTSSPVSTTASTEPA